MFNHVINDIVFKCIGCLSGKMFFFSTATNYLAFGGLPETPGPLHTEAERESTNF